MKSKKITPSEIASLKVASMPTRPTAPTYFGGQGATAAEVKAAFDRLPLYIIEKYNLLIGDIFGENGHSVADKIKTDISESHTLKKMFNDITNGGFAEYLAVGESTLLESILDLKEKVNILATHLGIDI